MRIAFVTDVHEDIVSLQKALRLIEREKCDQIICLGDITGYPYLRGKYESTRDLAACIALIRQNCSLVVLGNHDLFHLQRFPKHTAGFRFPADWYALAPEEKLLAAGDKVWNYSDDYPVVLTDKDAAYLENLPEFAFRDFGGLKLLISHYVYPNFSGYMLAGRNEGKRILSHFRYMREHSCSLSIFGHLHIEGIGLHYEPGEGIISRFVNGFDYYSFGEKRIRNKACSISIPALADNGQVNGFAIFDTDQNTINALSLNTNRRFIL